MTHLARSWRWPHVVATVLAVAMIAPPSARSDGRAADPPPIVYAVELIGPGRTTSEVGTASLATGTFDALHTLALTYGVELAVDAKTRRYAISSLLSDGKSAPVLDGHTARVKDDTSIFYLGTIGDGVTAAFAGDKTCVAGKCFETVSEFTHDGATLVTSRVTAAATGLRGYRVAAAPFGWALLDRRKKGVGFPSISPDGKRVAYQSRDGYHVEALPAPPKGKQRKPRAVKASKAVAPITLSHDDPLWLTEQEIIYAGRDESGTVHLEVLDLATKATRRVFTMPKGAPDWGTAQAYSAARRTFVFHTKAMLDDAPGELWAVTLDDGKPTKLLDEALYVFDVDPSGRWVLVGVPVARKGTDGWRPSFAFAAYDLEARKLAAVAPLSARDGYVDYDHPQAFFYEPAPAAND